MALFSNREAQNRFLENLPDPRDHIREPIKGYTLIEHTFWGSIRVPDAHIPHTTKDYLVVVTPTAWRNICSQVGRELCEFSVVHNQFGTVEGSMNNLPGAITLCETLQAALLKAKKEPSIATLVRVTSKDSPV